MLSACGFQLRGSANYQFTSVYVQRPTTFGVGTTNVAGTGAPVVPDVIDGLTRNGVTLKAKIEDADFAIRFQQVFFDKRVLSLSGGGRAREFELEYRVRYEFVDAKGRSWGEPRRDHYSPRLLVLPNRKRSRRKPKNGSSCAICSWTRRRKYSVACRL